MTASEKKKRVPLLWTQKLTAKLIETVKSGIIVCDRQGRMLFANKLALDLLDYSRQSLKGKPLEILFLPEDKKIFLPNIMKLTTKDSGFEGEAVLRRRSGTTFFVNLSTVMYRGDFPHHELIIFAVQDITYLKKMEKDYVDSERFAGLGVLTDQISHQIRNPIVSIGGFALRLAKDAVSSDEYVQYSRIIHSEARRLEHIINRLTEFAEVRPPHYTAVTLSLIFEGVKEAFSTHLNGNPVSLRLPDPLTLPEKPMFGDPSLLIRAFKAIVQNGLEAIHGGGEVKITGDIVDNQVLITVSDNGEGIAADNIPFIFDPFYTTKFNYLGLGLTLARRIIDEHRGLIKVQSTPTAGTEFHVILPRERRREIRMKLLSV